MTVQEMKSIVLPDSAEMTRRLEGIASLDITHARQKLFPKIAEAGGRELIGPGVVLMLNLAIADYTKGLPPMMAPIIQMSLPDMIAALIDDDEVKADALQMLADVDSAIEAKMAALPPPEPRPELSEEEKLALMRQIKRVAAIYDEYVDDPHHVSDKHRMGGNNPYYDHTLSGLFLEFYYGHPAKLWTPWGYWYFAAAQGYQTDLEGFMSRLEYFRYAQEYTDEGGVHGPTYGLLAVDGEPLPPPVRLEDPRQRMEYQPAKDEWNRLFAAV